MRRLREHLALKIAPWLVKPPAQINVYGEWISFPPSNVRLRNVRVTQGGLR